MLKRWLVRWLGLTELEQRVAHLEVELPTYDRTDHAAISRRVAELLNIPSKKRPPDECQGTAQRP